MITCKERILSNEYADWIVDFYVPEIFYDQLPQSFCTHQIEEQLVVAYEERTPELQNSLAAGNAAYTFLPKCYGLSQLEEVQTDRTERQGNPPTFNNIGLVESGILSAQGQPLNLTGRNVTIGFIDTGIQYQNPIFMDEYGRTRITAIWDQTIQTGNPPEGFLYGTEYTKEDIQRALDSDNPLSIVPSTDSNGHGTAVASVAAGSRVNGATQFIGAAPECNIVVVKLKEAKEYLKEYYMIPNGVPCYQENDIMLALQYLQRYVQVLYRPMAICIGVGTSQGDHAGNTMLDRYLSYISYRKSIALVVAGGNEGNASHHYHGELANAQSYRDVEIRVGANNSGFLLDMWGAVPYLLSVSIRTPGGENTQRISPRISGAQEISFVFERTRIWVQYLFVEQSSGVELVRFRVERPTEGIWTIRVQPEGMISNSHFDMWLPITQFLNSEVYFLESSPYTTITEPAYTSAALTVTAYQDTNNSLYLNAGRGFARDGKIKPDVAAPGVDISTALGSRSGTSMAAALAAGGAAQVLQWTVVETNEVFADSNTIKNYIIRGADRDSNSEYPNREWGDCVKLVLG